MFELLESRCLLATFTPADGAALAAAINAANATTDADEIDLGGGVFEVDPLPAIVSTLTIRNGTIRNVPDGYGLILQVDVERLTLQQVEISGGSGYYGGAVANYSELQVIDSIITGNEANYGYGGGIYNAGELYVSGSEFRNNHADLGLSYSGHGGALNNAGRAVIVGSTFTGNTASSYGGAVFNKGDMTLVDSVVSGNSVAGNHNGLTQGGGVYNGGSLVTLNTTITGNSAGYDDDVSNWGTWCDQTGKRLTVQGDGWQPMLVDAVSSGSDVEIVFGEVSAVFSDVDKLVIIGGPKDDVLRVDEALTIPTRLVGMGGDDVLIGGGGRDVLVGRAGNDVLRGGPGDDILRGNSGADILDGGDGTDALIPGAGKDVVESSDRVYSEADFTLARLYAAWLIDDE